MAGPIHIVEVPIELRSKLAAGHPWVYRNQVKGAAELASGSWVRIECGGFTAYGLWDAHNPIAVRVFSQHAVPDATWVAEQVAVAWELRDSIRSGATTAYRWLYGASDGLPGIVVDLYGDYAVARTYVEGVEALVPWVADALHAHKRLKGIVWRNRAGEIVVQWGRPAPSDLTVEEHGLLFRADLISGQKTGLYFDHRENRLTLASWCSGKHVLDCFCYTGAFSLYALRAGAESITGCDAAAEAIGAARQNLALNGFDAAAHCLQVQDCFDALEQYVQEGRRFGVVIVDPPSFARERSKRHAALRAYVRLNRLALCCVEPGGILASASCTSQISPEAFRQALGEAARQAGRRLIILHEAGQALDHPVPAHFPEARYLKFVVGRVSLPN